MKLSTCYFFNKIFFQNQILHTVLAVFGAFLFSAFIVYDTQMIMKHLHAEEYIVGVINLYLDIINLFLGNSILIQFFIYQT
jgi:FtsH-binding integral membrane protein